MCDIVTGIMAVTAIAGAVSSADAAGDAADQQINAARQTQVVADEAAAKGTAQNNAAAQQKKTGRALTATLERGRLRAAIGNTGLEGNGAQQLFLQSLFNEGQDTRAIETNRVAINDQIEMERKGRSIQTASQIASANSYRDNAMVSSALGLTGQLMNIGVRGGYLTPGRPSPSPNPPAIQGWGGSGYGGSWAPQ